MKTNKLLLIAFSYLTLVTSTVYGSAGNTGVPTYGSGRVINECIHDGQTYAVRTANGTCPGYFHLATTPPSPSSAIGISIPPPNFPITHESRIQSDPRCMESDVSIMGDGR